jgi:hypothetical protein
MKSFIRVGLPILLVVGGVFGITFIRMYSGNDESDPTDAKGTNTTKPAASQVLKFWTTSAVAPKGDIETVPFSLRHLYYWDPQVEMSAAGHFAFLCENRNPQPVTVRVPTTNCQCAGVDMAVLPSDVFRDYVIGSIYANSPLCPASAPTAALVNAALSGRLSWLPLFKDGERNEQTIPAADPASGGGPQFALIRLSWTGKGEPGAKSIAAQFFASIGDGPPSHTELTVQTAIVPAFQILKRTGPTQWTSARELPFGELRENGQARHTVFFASATRRLLVPSIATSKPDPCITWSEPVVASDEEVASLKEYARSNEASARAVRCLYKMEITVRERVEVVEDGKKRLYQLDLGPIDRKITATSADAGSWTLTLSGRVLGDVNVLGDSDGGRINLGNFPADQDKSGSVVLLAERSGLDLTLIETETLPNYAKVKLEPTEPLGDRKQWRLRVTIPKGSLYGSLPENSGIILKTNDPIPRRFRIPIRGMTYDSGGPRL